MTATNLRGVGVDLESAGAVGATTHRNRHERRDFKRMPKPRGVILVGQVLPEDFAAQLRALHEPVSPEFDAALAMAIEDGWTGAALARALGITRERVLQRAHLGNGPAPRGLKIPSPPCRPPKPRYEEPRLAPEIVGRLRELHSVAKTVNGGAKSDDPRRQASVELAALMAQCVAQGFGTVRLGRLLGIVPSAVQFYLGRHGYRALPPSLAGNRYQGHGTGERAAPGGLPRCPEAVPRHP